MWGGRKGDKAHDWQAFNGLLGEYVVLWFHG